jgi:hypothetical protein
LLSQYLAPSRCLFGASNIILHDKSTLSNSK